MNKIKTKIYQRFKGKQICILGFGKEGQSSLKFLRSIFPNKIIGIADIKQVKVKDTNTKLHLGNNYLKFLKHNDVIFRSPGIPLSLVKKNTKKNSLITSQTKLFFNYCPAQIVGVTGTKGKSTTASLIYKVLTQKYHSYLVGNIGQAPLDSLLGLKLTDKVVFELSSHQLIDLNQSPSITVLLNIFPDHLDYYHNFKKYYEAKANIFKYQNSTDILIYNSDNQVVKKLVKKAKAKKIKYSINDQHLKIFESQLIGDFNQLNIIPAVIIGQHFNIIKSKITSAIRAFKPLPDRLEKVGQYKGITFINDSLATTPPATIGAINALGEKISCLIVGGFDRGIDQLDLINTIIKHQISIVITLPDTGNVIYQSLTKKRFNGQVFKANTIQEAVKLSFQYIKKGKYCLMSPAAASFNMFKNYKDRGEQFIKAVGNL